MNSQGFIKDFLSKHFSQLIHQRFSCQNFVWASFFEVFPAKLLGYIVLLITHIAFCKNRIWTMQYCWLAYSAHSIFKCNTKYSITCAHYEFWLATYGAHTSEIIISFLRSQLHYMPKGYSQGMGVTTLMCFTRAVEMTQHGCDICNIQDCYDLQFNGIATQVHRNLDTLINQYPEQSDIKFLPLD